MDGLTLAASIAGLVSVAQVVVEKGYRYLKAVKNCEEEVRKLIVETNVFCGIIERLARFAEDEEDEEGPNSTGFYSISGLLIPNAADSHQRR